MAKKSAAKRRTFEDVFVAKQPGDPLDSGERRIVQNFIGKLLAAADQRRKGKLLSHNTLQDLAGWYFSQWGYAVGYEAPFHRGGFSRENVRFDVIAEKKKEFIAIEIKDNPTARDVGQVDGYIDLLQSVDFKAEVYLGFDFLSLLYIHNNARVLEQVGEQIRDEGLKIFLLDKLFCLLIDDFDQWNLKAMPEFYFVEQ